MTLEPLLGRIAACEICRDHLPLGPKPLLKVAPEVRVLVIGQAPGRLAHVSGVPWDDPSGNRLRDWLGISSETFYEHPGLGLMPMGFCYPGTGQGGDLAPRPECAETWHEELLASMPHLETTVLIGRYAQLAYLPETADKRAAKKRSVTEVVRAWQETFPRILPLPHPSPRNNRWLRNNPWFEAEVLPALRDRVSALLAGK
ncbi:MAG: uracil-DNA glycosylase family protein [Acidobacteriota bacterium]